MALGLSNSSNLEQLALNGLNLLIDRLNYVDNYSKTSINVIEKRWPREVSKNKYKFPAYSKYYCLSLLYRPIIFWMRVKRSKLCTISFNTFVYKQQASLVMLCWPVIHAFTRSHHTSPRPPQTMGVDPWVDRGTFPLGYFSELLCPRTFSGVL